MQQLPSRYARVDHLRNSTGPILDGTNTALVAAGGGQTVFDDGVRDVLSGNSGRDWFFASLLDRVDLKADEFEDVIG